MKGIARWLAYRVREGVKSESPEKAAEPEKKEESFAPKIAHPKRKVELGVAGTVNYDGALQVEEKVDLQDEAARGTPGVGTTWGEWERVVRTDSACASSLNMVVAPLRDADVEVEPAEDVPDGETHAELVRDNLLKWIEPQWPQFLEACVTGFLGHGFDIHEIVWGLRPDERVPGGTAMFVSKLAQRLPSSLHTNAWQERDGELVEVWQSGWRPDKKSGAGYQEKIVLPAEKLLLTSWQRSGNNYQGFSVFRPVHYLVLLRRMLLKILGIGAEREALGVPVASTDKDAKLTPEQKNELQAFLQNIVAHEHAAAVMPPGVSVEWVYSTGANKGHVLETWRQLGIAIMEVLQTQQQALGTGETGSRSVGQVHDATKNAFIAGVKSNLEAVLNGVGERPYTGLARKIVECNFGPQPAYPRIRLTLKRTELDAQQLSSAVSSLVTAGGLTITADDENRFRERVGLPPIDPKVREAELKRKAEEALAIAGEKAKASGFPAKGKDDDEDLDDAIAGEKKPKKLSERRTRKRQWKRALHAWERTVRLAAIENTLDTRREEFVEQVGALLTAAVARAMPDIRRAMEDGDTSDVEAVPLDFSEVDAYLERFIWAHVELGRAEVFAEAANQAQLASRGRASVVRLEEEDDKDAPLPGEPPSRAEPPAPSPAERSRVARLVRRMRERLLGRMRARTIDDIEAEAQRVLRTGEDPADLVKRVVERALVGKGLKFDAGSVQATAFSMGREEFARERADQVVAVRYSAILDSNTCGPCNAADGQEFDFGSAEHDGHVPPFRDCDGGEQCRCLLVYEFKEAGFAP